jgi:FMN-dependent NADH-azoreductase
VAELKAADTMVIGLPIYNFGVPAALKAWVDLVARAGVTFKYSEYGPKGLLEGKRAIVAVASGGTEAGSEIDFATGLSATCWPSSASRTWSSSPPTG